MSERPQANRHLVSPRYFQTLGIPLRAGRDFDERDNARMPHVVIVNETFAQRHFPGENPLGRTLVTGMGQRQAQIVGVVADVRSTGLNTPPEADYFLPALQRPETFTNILVRTNLAPAAMAPLVREALRAVDPDLPLLEPETLSARIAETVANRKLALMLLAGLAGLALVLACLGVYSVMAHLVAFRTERDRHPHGAGRDTRRRDAPGARPWPAADAARHRPRHRRRLVVSRLMQQALFEVDPADPLHLPRGVGHPAGRGRERIVVPGPPGHAHRSGDRAADGIDRVLGLGAWVLSLGLSWLEARGLEPEA